MNFYGNIILNTGVSFSKKLIKFNQGYENEVY